MNRHRPAAGVVRRRRGLAGTLVLLLGTLTLIAPAAAQPVERYRGRLSIMPVDVATAGTVTGSGEVTGVVVGDTLTIEATFSGLSAPATAAELRQAARGRRGDVVVSLAIDDTDAATGRLREVLRLTPAQLAVLRDERYYLQIRTSANPDGEIRGWLLARE